VILDMPRRRAPAAVHVADPLGEADLDWRYVELYAFVGTESVQAFLAKYSSPLCQCPTARDTAVL